MKKSVSWLIVIVAAAGVIGVFYQRRLGKEPPVPIATTLSPPPSAPPQKGPAEPLVRYPIPKPPPPQEKAAAGQAEVHVAPLPPLDQSDGAVGRALAQLVGQQLLDTWFNLSHFVRRIAVTVDNLPRRQVPPRYLPMKPVDGAFLVTGTDENPYLDPANYRRYTPYVKLLEEVNAKKLIAFYIRFYPLFQKAYADLGYPKAYFNDRLVAAIDDLLAAPNVQGPIKLVRPNVVYKFADPRLEQLSAGQKLMIRMGPDNARRVKAKLRELRHALMEQVAESDRSSTHK